MRESTTTAVSRGRQHIIKRPRLTRLLDETTARIIMLVAPAGYGKTTLARQWLAEGERPHVWFRATAASHDVAAFASGIAGSLRLLSPSAGGAMSDYLRTSSAPAAEAHVLAELLASEINDLRDDALLVIDDYDHAARSAPSDLFIDVLASASPVRLFLLSRRRPTWALARRVIYGEITIVGREELAMTPSEALRVLPPQRRDEARELAESSGGWPAILGLAALTTTRASAERSMSQSLYEFLAEDLYRASPPEVQQAVAALSLAPRIDPELAQAMIGSNSDAVLSNAIEAGFLTTSASPELEMHPLLRRFLQDRLQQDEDVRVGAVKRLGRFLLDNARWDDAFEVIRETRAVDLFDELITQSLRGLLEDGRLATLETWIAFASQNAHASPALDVAAAEVALRSAEHRKAGLLAAEAIRALEPESILLSRAHLVAARASHLTSKEERAYAELNEAVQTARSLRDRYDAMWLRYICACELERPGLEAMLWDFEGLPDTSVDHGIRIETGRTFLRMYEGNLGEQVLDPATVIELASRVLDPMVRTSFFNLQTAALVVHGRYNDAAALADAYIDYLDRVRLRFALPHAYLSRAGAELGRRNFAQAEAALDTALDLGVQDPYVEVACATLRSRVLIAQRRFEEAIEITSQQWQRLPISAAYAEYLGTHALALACIDKVGEALRLAETIEKLTIRVEARTLAKCVSAVAQLRAGDNAGVMNAFDYLHKRGAYDSLVCTYRAEPRILPILNKELRSRRTLLSVIADANDRVLLSDPPVEERPPKLAALTIREMEVLDLVAQGKTNREIANALYITEVTAKVHVRHILEKLDVRSRTEAAIIALGSRPR